MAGSSGPKPSKTNTPPGAHSKPGNTPAKPGANNAEDKPSAAKPTATHTTPPNTKPKR